MKPKKGKSFINLEQLAGGAFAEKLNEALLQVAENIQNPNTDAVAKRGITINLKFAPNKSRQIVNTTIAVTTKLAATEAIDTQMVMGLNLRTGPSMDAAIITSFQPGTAVTVLKRGRGWHYVSVSGEKGYMGSQYLVERKKSEDVGKPDNGSFQAKLYNPNGGRIVNFRQGAGLNAKIIRAYPVGTPVTVLEEGANWCRVRIDGQTGYVSTYFLKR